MFIKDKIMHFPPILTFSGTPTRSREPSIDRAKNILTTQNSDQVTIKQEKAPALLTEAEAAEASAVRQVKHIITNARYTREKETQRWEAWQKELKKGGVAREPLGLQSPEKAEQNEVESLIFALTGFKKQVKLAKEEKRVEAISYWQTRVNELTKAMGYIGIEVTPPHTKDRTSLK
jgi:hypothetical protein